MISHLFAGSGTLTRFILKRDRIRLLIWIIGLCGFAVSFIPIFENILNTGDNNQMMLLMMESPVMVSILGVPYGAANYNTGAMYANMMLLFLVMIAGVMNIFLVSRHTRQDEEMGRLEVIRSLPVGRLSNLASTMIVTVIANFLLALLTGGGMFALRETGMTFSGCMLFGVSLGVIGLFFAASTAIFCQCTANNRTATGLSILLLFVLYMLRAAGDIGTEILSLISPLGLILRTEAFVSNYWWPIWMILGISVVLTFIAFVLARTRDLGRGLVPEKPGRRHASVLLSSPFGLAFKLLRTSIIVWLITMFVMGGMYGSVFDSLEGFLSGNEVLGAIFAASEEFSATEQFAALLMTIMSMLTVIPVINFVARITSEEKHGHTEHLLGHSVSRQAQMGAYLIPAFIISVVLQVLMTLGLWMVGSIVLDTIPSLTIFMVSAMSYLPAIWVMLGVTIFLVAFLPRFTSAAYVYLGYSFVSVYMGTLVGLPEWMQKITPFGYISQYPIEEMEVAPLFILTGIAALLLFAGFIGYRKRDMLTQ